MKKVGLLSLFVFLSCCAIGSRNITSKELALQGDGLTLNTMAIQQAIDEIACRGGGTLTFYPGRFLTGGIIMKSGVTLHLMEGATLLGSKNPYDYRSVSRPKEDNTEHDLTSKGLIMAVNAENIGLTGAGTIDGQGLALSLFVDSLHHTGEWVDLFYNKRRLRPSGSMRPNLFFFCDCKQVMVEGLHLRNSAGWGLSFDRCEQLTLKDLVVYNRAYWNNDGIDITDCCEVRIDHCMVDAADDGICLKSNTTNLCCRDVEISNCQIKSSASAIKMGTASWGGFRKVSIHDIKVSDTFRSAIAIESVDGGIIDSIKVENIHALNTGNAIFLRLGARAGERKGELKNVVIRNLYAEIPFGRPDINYDLRGPEVDFFHNPFPSSISGIPEATIENIMLENIEMVFPGRATKGMAYLPLWRVKDVPEQIEKYPEFSMFGELPSWGFYVRHARGITFRNISLRLQDNDFRPAFVFDDVEQLRFDNISVPPGSTKVFHAKK